MLSTHLSSKVKNSSQKDIRQTTYQSSINKTDSKPEKLTYATPTLTSPKAKKILKYLNAFDGAYGALNRAGIHHKNNHRLRDFANSRIQSRADNGIETLRFNNQGDDTHRKWNGGVVLLSGDLLNGHILTLEEKPTAAVNVRHEDERHSKPIMNALAGRMSALSIPISEMLTETYPQLCETDLLQIANSFIKLFSIEEVKSSRQLQDALTECYLNIESYSSPSRDEIFEGHPELTHENSDSFSSNLVINIKPESIMRLKNVIQMNSGSFQKGTCDKQLLKLNTLSDFSTLAQPTVDSVKAKLTETGAVKIENRGGVRTSLAFIINGYLNAQFDEKPVTVSKKELEDTPTRNHAEPLDLHPFLSPTEGHSQDYGLKRVRHWINHCKKTSNMTDVDSWHRFKKGGTYKQALWQSIGALEATGFHTTSRQHHWLSISPAGANYISNLLNLNEKYTDHSAIGKQHLQSALNHLSARHPKFYAAFSSAIRMESMTRFGISDGNEPMDFKNPHDLELAIGRFILTCDESIVPENLKLRAYSGPYYQDTVYSWLFQEGNEEDHQAELFEVCANRSVRALNHELDLMLEGLIKSIDMNETAVSCCKSIQFNIQGMIDKVIHAPEKEQALSTIQQGLLQCKQDLITLETLLPQEDFLRVAHHMLFLADSTNLTRAGHFTVKDQGIEETETIIQQYLMGDMEQPTSIKPKKNPERTLSVQELLSKWVHQSLRHKALSVIMEDIADKRAETDSNHAAAHSGNFLRGFAFSPDYDEQQAKVLLCSIASKGALGQYGIFSAGELNDNLSDRENLGHPVEGKYSGSSDITGNVSTTADYNTAWGYANWQEEKTNLFAIQLVNLPKVRDCGGFYAPMTGKFSDRYKEREFPALNISAEQHVVSIIAKRLPNKDVSEIRQVVEHTAKPGELSQQTSANPEQSHSNRLFELIEQYHQKSGADHNQSQIYIPNRLADQGIPKPKAARPTHLAARLIAHSDKISVKN